MIAYETDGLWFLEAEGGHINRERVGGTVMGPFAARPEPLAQWREHESDCYGSAVRTYTLFGVGEVPVATRYVYDWSPAPGYSADIWHETLTAPTPPPVLGAAYQWSSQGWERTPHPDAPRDWRAADEQPA